MAGRGLVVLRRRPVRGGHRAKMSASLAGALTAIAQRRRRTYAVEPRRASDSIRSNCSCSSLRGGRPTGRNRVRAITHTARTRQWRQRRSAYRASRSSSASWRTSAGSTGCIQRSSRREGPRVSQHTDGRIGSRGCMAANLDASGLRRGRDGRRRRSRWRGGRRGGLGGGGTFVHRAVLPRRNRHRQRRRAVLHAELERVAVPGVRADLVLPEAPPGDARRPSCEPRRLQRDAIMEAHTHHVAAAQRDLGAVRVEHRCQGRVSPCSRGVSPS